MLYLCFKFTVIFYCIKIILVLASHDTNNTIQQCVWRYEIISSLPLVELFRLPQILLINLNNLKSALFNNDFKKVLTLFYCLFMNDCKLYLLEIRLNFVLMGREVLFTLARFFDLYFIRSKSAFVIDNNL